MPPRTNAKAAAGRERKAEQKAQKDAADARRQEEAEAEEWKKGANVRGSARAETAAAKADEAARKRREKEELLAAEEAALGSGGKPKKTPALSAKKKKGKKDDLSLLEDALVKSAEKKTRAKKQLEQEKQQEQLRKQQEAKERAQQEAPAMDPLLANTESMLESPAGRDVNKAQDAAASGIDAALDSLNVGGTPEVKSQKALHKEFEERMLPVLKEEYPGLRLSQYKERIFAMWKKSPENPANQVPPS